MLYTFQVVFGQLDTRRLPETKKTLAAPVAQGIEHSFPKAGVGGSNPLGSAFFWGVHTAVLPDCKLSASTVPVCAVQFAISRLENMSREPSSFFRR